MSKKDKDDYFNPVLEVDRGDGNSFFVLENEDAEQLKSTQTLINRILGNYQSNISQISDKNQSNINQTSDKNQPKSNQMLLKNEAEIMLKLSSYYDQFRRLTDYLNQRSNNATEIQTIENHFWHCYNFRDLKGLERVIKELSAKQTTVATARKNQKKKQKQKWSYDKILKEYQPLVKFLRSKRNLKKATKDENGNYIKHYKQLQETIPNRLVRYLDEEGIRTRSGAKYHYASIQQTVNAMLNRKNQSFMKRNKNKIIIGNTIIALVVAFFFGAPYIPALQRDVENYRNDYFIITGSFSQPNKAKEQLKAAGKNAYLMKAGDVYRIVSETYTTLDSAKAAIERYENAWILKK